MDTLPIGPAPVPSTPAGADCAAEGASSSDAPQENGFQAVLTRSIAGQAPDTTTGDETGSDSASEETGAAADETALLAEGVPSASDSALALLAALPQQAVRAAGANGSDGKGPLGAVAGEIGAGTVDRPGAAPSGAGRRPHEAGVRENSIALPGAGDAAALRAAELERTAETALQSMQSVSDANAGAPQQPVHATAHAAWSAAATGAADAAAGATSPAAPRIETPLGAPGWSTALADRLVMFAHDKQQIAELHINPPHLGPVDITLTVGDGEASAVFASPHAIVRETIETALPRLREVLAESGINLGQASVTSDSPRDGSAQAQSRSSFAGGGDRSVSDITHAGAAARAVGGSRARGLVDLFA